MNSSLNHLIKLLIFTLIFPLIFLNVWLAFKAFQHFKPLVTILILATLLAFILNYPVAIFQRWGVKRSYAVALVIILTFVILLTLGITLLPVVLEQFNEIVKLFPEWIDSTEKNLHTFNDLVLTQKLRINLGEILTNLIDRLPNELEYIGNSILSVLLETIDSISVSIITIVLTFYMLLDSQRLSEGIFKKLPINWREKIRSSLHQNFENYLIGQVSLAFLIGISQTTVFLIFQVEFGLLFGLGIGIMSLIPFGDVVGLMVINLIIASYDFWLSVKILAIAVVVDQLIDGAIAPVF